MGIFGKLEIGNWELWGGIKFGLFDLKLDYFGILMG
jgi:hypothetical protein